MRFMGYRIFGKTVREWIEQYKDFILYIVFGVLTTAVNYAAYYCCTRWFLMGTLPATIVAWIMAVLFAYITNRKWVFHSTADTLGGITRELVSFFGCRVATGVLDWLIMYVSVDVWNWNDLIMKLVSNVVVILLNYVASRLLIFKKDK